MSAARVLLLSGLAALALAFAFDERLPTRRVLLPALHAEPAQSAVVQPAFMVQAGGVDYRIAPQADYDIAGLVVSRHDTSTWWNWIHAASNDHLNVADLCMVWGANAAEGAYEKMSFSSGQFVCYVKGDDPSAFRADYLRALSNNHLLTDSLAVARTLRDVRIGDQVRLRGQLVHYSHNAGFAFMRGTSLTREDTRQRRMRNAVRARRGSAAPGARMAALALWAGRAAASRWPASLVRRAAPAPVLNAAAPETARRDAGAWPTPARCAFAQRGLHRRAMLHSSCPWGTP